MSKQNNMADNSKPITGAVLGDPCMYKNSFGDTWTNTWANDDNIYTLSCDTKGWYEGCSSLGSNLAVNMLTGGEPYYDNLDGKTINTMKAHPFNFGLWAQMKYDDDGVIRMWKGNGLSFIDGVLYMSVSRHGAMAASTRYIQDAVNASILKSLDYGRTWTPSENDAYFKPMFPAKSFSVPFFVEYGKNGKVPDGYGGWMWPPHGGDRYVYAVSNDGFWNNGNYMKLGRIRRDKLENLNPLDWEFYSGPAGDAADGLEDMNWGKDPDSAAAILRDKEKLSQAGIQYIWPLNRYIMIQAYYPAPYSENFDTTRTIWDFYEAPAPWGPWTRFHEQEFNGNGGYYNPDIVSKSIKYDSAANTCSMSVLTAGDWKTHMVSDTVYRMTVIPVTLNI